MKKVQVLVGLMLVAVLAAPTVFAQSTNENDDNQVAGGLQPAMPDLFFRQEQRRVLEAVRHGLVDQGYFNDVKKLSPVILVQRTIPEAPVEEVEELLRSGDLMVNAMIYNRAKKTSHIWVNNQLVDAEDQYVLENEGLVIEDGGDGGSYIVGNDTFSQSRFKVKVGQIIGVDGRIEEGLPVVNVQGKQ